MNEKSYLPDSSAFLTLIENEAGADTVERVLRQEKIILPAMVLLEVYYVSYLRAGRSVAEKRYSLLKQLQAEHLSDLTEPVILQAGHFKAKHRLSLADAVIAAHAHIHQAILLHKDPEYEPLDTIQQEALPYKASR